MRRKLDAGAQEFTKQAQRLLRAFDSTNHAGVGPCCDASHKPARANCVLNLSNQWALFCQNLLTRSAVGGWETRSGVILTRVTGLPPNNDVLAFIRSQYGWRPPREPHWTIAAGYGNFIDACTRVGIANLADVSAAIGTMGTSGEELRLTRNYLAHRNPSTAQNVERILRAYRNPGPFDVDLILRSPTRAGSHLFEEWVNDLTAMAYAAC